MCCMTSSEPRLRRTRRCRSTAARSEAAVSPHWVAKAATTIASKLPCTPTTISVRNEISRLLATTEKLPAMPRCSRRRQGRSWEVPLLLVAQGYRGVEPGRAGRRVDAEEESDPAGNADRKRDRPGRDVRRKRRGEAHHRRRRVADGDSDQPPR